jgi:hypothetical protein
MATILVHVVLMMFLQAMVFEWLFSHRAKRGGQAADLGAELEFSRG